MSLSSDVLRVGVAFLGLAVIGGGASLAADTPPAKGGDDAKAKEQAKALREQTIYVPYDKLRNVFEQHGRGVFLPYEKFQELWQAARKATAEPIEAPPPVKAVIMSAENEAVAAKDVVRVRAKLKIEVLAEGWNEIPLRLADCAITRAQVGDEPARLVGSSDRGYSLIVEKKGKTPESLELTLEYARAITKTPGQNSVSFQTPQSVVSRWQVRIPESGVKVNVQPMIATTELPATKPAGGVKRVEETVLQAFVGASPSVRIEWTPKAEGATGLEALASVQTEQQVAVGAGTIRTRARLAYTISRAELAQLSVEVPADQKVVNVFDANVRQWRVEQAGGVQKISITLFEPAKSLQQIQVELEKLFGQKGEAAVSIPVIKAVGAGRQSGTVVVAVDEGLRAEAVRSQGLLQTDASDMPPGLTGGKWTFSYRYAAVPFELSLAVEKVQPRVLADSLIEACLEPERLTLDATVLYTIERAGVFRLELEKPGGYQVRQVRGVAVSGATAVQVDSHHLEGEKQDRLIVELSRKAMGRVGLKIELARELREPALLAPVEKDARIAVAVPRVLGAIERSVGKVVVYAPESLRVNQEKTEGLRAITFQETQEPVAWARSTRTSQSQPVLAFAYTQDPTDLTLRAQRRKPQVTVAQLLLVRVDEGVVKFQATFFYNVQYSGIKSLRVDLPKRVAGRLHDTPGIHRKEIEPQPNDVAAGDVAWSLSGDAELIGSGRMELNWEEEETLGKLEVGKPATLVIPRLRPRDVDRGWGQIVLVKAETIDVQESSDASGLRPIDPQHDLMPGAKVAGAARAMEFHDDWKLSVIATRYQLEEAKRTSIERAVVRMVITRAGQVSVQALYRLRSARQRLEVAMPEGVAFESGALRINGRPVTLERGQNNRFFVPLIDANPDDSASLLELRYTVPGDGRRLDLPSFPEDPAVQKVFVCVYVPQERVLIHKSGPWTEEFDWSLGRGGRWRSAARTADRTDKPLIQWLIEGKTASAWGNPDSSFPTDGQLYVFSTVRPADPPEGSLRLRTVHESTLAIFVLGGVLIVGLLLTGARIGTRVFFLAVLLIAIVGCGMFWPIAARQIVDARFVSALMVVLALWGIVWSFRLCCCMKSCKPASAEPLSAAAPHPASTPAAEPACDEGGLSHE
jgi:hypothetical protein